MGRDKWNEITDKYRLSKWVAEERYADQKQKHGNVKFMQEKALKWMRGEECHIYIVFCFDAKRLSWDYEDKNKVFKFLKSPNIFVEWQQWFRFFKNSNFN